MKYLFTRYRPRYIRSLVYMLQASEYDVHDYLAWVKRTNDFAHVEKRKKLEMTYKAVALLVLTWGLFLWWCFSVMYVANSTGSDVLLIVGAFIVVISPIFLPYAILIPLLILQVIQWPIERYLVTQTAQRLAKHGAIKIAIAGSYGKTSMREILRTVLSEGRKVAAPPGSYNTPLGVASFVRNLKGDEDVLIFELGEYYPGDVRTLARIIQPDWGVITGVNEAHLKKFKTLERTSDTIFELAEFIGPMHLYINGENAFARKRAGDNVVLYTRGGAGKWSIQNAVPSLSGTVFTLTDGIDTIEVSTKLLGLHMLPSLATAADIASQLGYSTAQIGSALSNTKPFAHRLEPKQWPDGVTFIDDSYNGNPDGVRAAIAFLASLSGRKFYVTPGLVETGEKAQAIHEEIGQELARAGIEKVALIKNSVTPYIDSGLKKAGFKGEVLWYHDMPSCLNTIQTLTLPGDIILVQNDWPDQYA